MIRVGPRLTGLDHLSSFFEIAIAMLMRHKIDNIEQRRKHPGRQELPPDLPRMERVVTCTPEQCVCPGCGQTTAVIGYDESAQLDVEPVQYFVVVTKREKRACPGCQERWYSLGPDAASHHREGLGPRPDRDR